MSDRDDTRAEGYNPPQVEDVPAEDGPAITSAGLTGDDDSGPEWRPGGDVDKERE